MTTLDASCKWNHTAFVWFLGKPMGPGPLLSWSDLDVLLTAEGHLLFCWLTAEGHLNMPTTGTLEVCHDLSKSHFSSMVSPEASTSNEKCHITCELLKRIRTTQTGRTEQPRGTSFCGGWKENTLCFCSVSHPGTADILIKSVTISKISLLCFPKIWSERKCNSDGFFVFEGCSQLPH